jgi:hypothetical protein
MRQLAPLLIGLGATAPEAHSDLKRYDRQRLG